MQARCTTCAEKARSGNLDAARPALAGASERLPHFDRIQASFGRHDLSEVRTITGGAARTANDEIGARAFTAGNRIGFRAEPDLWLAAHESAHVIQQRDGTKLPGESQADPWERHADSVADAVSGGVSAEPILDRVVTGSGSSQAPGLQRDEKDKKQVFADESQEDFEKRVKSAAGGRLAQNIATLTQWSAYVSSMDAFQLKAQLLTGKAMDWVTTARGMHGGDRKAETLFATDDWGERAHLDQVLSSDSTYLSRVAGADAMTRTRALGYFTTPPISTRFQVLAGDLSEADLPASVWVEPDPQYEFYADYHRRKDSKAFNSGCQNCHESKLATDLTYRKYGSTLPTPLRQVFASDFLTKYDAAALFAAKAGPKAPLPSPTFSNEDVKALVGYLRSFDTPAAEAPVASGAAGSPQAMASSPFLPAGDVPATITVPPPRSNLCGALPEAPAGAPGSSDFSTWGPHSAIVASVVARVNAVLTPLGPRGYRVLTSDSFDALWSMTPDNIESVRGHIVSQIAQRIGDYKKLKGRIEGGSVPYYELCPIVDELLPTTSEEVKAQAITDILEMRFLETIVTAAEIVLIGLSFMFPPAAIVTVPASIALGLVRVGIGAEQMRQGEQWSEGIGSGLFSAEQEAQAPGLRKRGAINIAAGVFSAVMGMTALSKAAQTPETLVRVIETPAGLMVTHKMYPGTVIWIEGNAVQVMNEAGEVIANGVLTQGGVVWGTAGEAAGASTAIVPYGSNALVPYAQGGVGPLIFPGAGAPPPMLDPTYMLGTGAASPLLLTGPKSPLLLPGPPQPKGLLPAPVEPSPLLSAPNAALIPGNPSAGIATGGSSQSLGRAIMRSYGLQGTPFKGWQPHHIIPSEAAELDVIKKIGMNLDDASNGILLPDKAGMAGAGNLPTHKGFHSAYNDAVIAALKKIDTTKPIAELQKEVYRIQQQAREAILQGTPLYYSKGATGTTWPTVFK